MATPILCYSGFVFVYWVLCLCIWFCVFVFVFVHLVLRLCIWFCVCVFGLCIWFCVFGFVYFGFVYLGGPNFWWTQISGPTHRYGPAVTADI